MKHILRNTIVSALTIPSVSTAADWMNVQPAYNVEADHVTVRLEGSVSLGKDWSLYGFGDFDANSSNGWYIEPRLLRSLSTHVSALGEINAADGLDTIVRGGIQINPTTGKSNFTSIRLTHSNKGPQAGVFTEQKLPAGGTLGFLAEYNIDGEKAYSELEFRKKFFEKFEGFAQLRIFGPNDASPEYSTTPVFGVRYSP